MNSLPIQEIEEKIKGQTTSLSEVHRYGHLGRTAIGAQFFSRFFGESEEDQGIAYVAGLIHDLERPNTEKIDHSDISVREATKFLSPFSVDQETKDEIILLIQTHRHAQDIPLSEQWVYLSDKLFEQMGAYVIFRRSYYVGECEDFINVSMEEAVTSHMKTRMEKFHPDVFNIKLRKLAEYQYEWEKEFINAFEKKEKWAWQLTQQFYTAGRKKTPFESLINSFLPLGVEDLKFKDEAIAYIYGKKYSFFESLLLK